VLVLVFLAHSHVWRKLACCSQRLLQGSADRWLIGRFECNRIVHTLRATAWHPPCERDDLGYRRMPRLGRQRRLLQKFARGVPSRSARSKDVSMAQENGHIPTPALATQVGSFPRFAERASSRHCRQSSVAEREAAIRALDGWILHRASVELASEFVTPFGRAWRWRMHRGMI